MLPGLERGAFAQLRFTGKGPNYRKSTPKTVLYVESEVTAWVESSARWGLIDDHEAKPLQGEVAKLEKRWMAAHDSSQQGEDS